MTKKTAVVLEAAPKTCEDWNVNNLNNLNEATFFQSINDRIANSKSPKAVRTAVNAIAILAYDDAILAEHLATEIRYHRPE